MKRQILVALGIAILSMPMTVLAAANLSGSWARDNEKSDQVPNFTYWLTRESNIPGGGGGRGRGGPGRGPGPVTKIEQTGNTLTITDPNGGVRKVNLDGKPNQVPTPTMIQKATVTGKVEGDSVVIDTVQPWGGMPGNVSLEQKETWTVSPDGKTLTVTTTRIDPATVTKTYKQTYTKQ